jgi:hypothetical protein
MRVAWIALGIGLLAVTGCSNSLYPPPGTPTARPTTVHGVPLTHLPPHTAVAGRDHRTRAELDVVSGATTVSVTTANLGGVLLTATTPSNSGVTPDLVGGGTVQVFLDSTGLPGPAALHVVLNSAVTWQLVFSGGASQTSVDLSGGRFSSADFAAGSSLITLALPRPAGTASVVLAGGASQFSLSLPAGVPARFLLDGGASTATLGAQSYTGIAGGTVLTMPGWPAALSRYEIDAPAGVSSISATNR